MSFRTPKLWIPGEPYTPEDFNIYLTNNLTSILNRPGGEYRDTADLDQTVTSTTFIPIPTVTAAVAATPTAPSRFLFNLSIRLSNSIANRTCFDIYLRNQGVFLSNMTAAPPAQGLWSIEQHDNSIYRPHFTWLTDVFPEDNYIFDLYVAVTGGTTTLYISSDPIMFQVVQI